MLPEDGDVFVQEATAVGPVVAIPGQIIVVPMPLTPNALGVHDNTPTVVLVVWQLVTTVATV